MIFLIHFWSDRYFRIPVFCCADVIVCFFQEMVLLIRIPAGDYPLNLLFSETSQFIVIINTTKFTRDLLKEFNLSCFHINDYQNRII